MVPGSDAGGTWPRDGHAEREESTVDPDANLTEQLARAAEILTIDDEATGQDEYTREQLDEIAGAAVRLAELVEALDQWIRRSSNPPHAWTRDHAGWHQDGYVPTVS